MNSKRLPTLIGISAVLMWALLALLTSATGTVPPLQLTAMTFFVGTLTGLIYYRSRGAWPRIAWDQPLALVAGTLGIFLYHVFYFTALRNAPAIEASLIAYLWPLLIVLGSALLPGERLGWHHLLGALLGFAGAGLIVTGGQGFGFQAQYGFGYGMAFLCALTWSAYSLVARAFKTVPSDTVVLLCAMTSLLALGGHVIFETTVWPSSVLQWFSVLGLGLLPVGAAFYTWDYGCKNGDIQVLGAASYLTPLLSTLVLVAADVAALNNILIAACLLIMFGAVLAAKDMIFKKGSQD